MWFILQAEPKFPAPRVRWTILIQGKLWRGLQLCHCQTVLHRWNPAQKGDLKLYIVLEEYLKAVNGKGIKVEALGPQLQLNFFGSWIVFTLSLLLGSSGLLHYHSRVPHSVCLFYQVSHSLLQCPAWVKSWVSCLYSAHHIGTVETLGSVWHCKGTSENKQVVIIVAKQNLDWCWVLVKTWLHFLSLRSPTHMNFLASRF